MKHIRLAVALALAAPAAHAQMNSVAAGASLPVGNYASAANTGFGLALLSRTDETLGPFNIRVDLTFDRFGGKGAISRYQYTSGGLSLIRDMGPHVYWLAGFGLYNASDQLAAKVAGKPGAASHSNGGVQAGLGVNFTILGQGAFIEADIVRLFASGPGLTWVPVRLGIRI